MIRYRIELADPQAHRYHAMLTVAAPAAQQRVSLPAWIPGSYMVRDFARHLSGLKARQGAKPVPLEQLDKATWTAACSGRAALELSYDVYAFDTSVRAAFLDGRRGFFNGTSLCLRVEGREHEPHALTLGPLPAGWSVATAMPAAPGAKAQSRREYLCADYDELVDHPFELGEFWRGEFVLRGVPHSLVVNGAWPGFDGPRLLADTQRICEAQMTLWHGKRGRPPMDRYLFLLNAVDEGYGGLEHSASTALVANRRDLPRVATAQAAPSDGYVNLLGLISHEYFHAWNVKRVKPREFARLDYSGENYTRLLWFFEGFTAYYDDLMLVRAGLIDEARYLKLLAKAVNGVFASPGRQLQSVADASFDAWVKYYRADENTPNATVSYYQKGSLVALALDLTLRSSAAANAGANEAANKAAKDGAEVNLDALMRRLWHASHGGPIDEADILRELATLAGRPLERELRAWVHGSDELPLDALLAQAGLQLRPEAPGLAAALGLKLAEGPLSGVQVKSVLRGGVAERAGISAGDELLAVNGWRVRRLDDAQQWTAPGDEIEMLLVREQRVVSLRLRRPPLGAAAPATTVALVPQDKPTAAATALRRQWLGG